MRFSTVFDLDVAPIRQVAKGTPYPTLGVFVRPNSYTDSAREQRRERWEVEFRFAAQITNDQITEVGLEDPLVVAISKFD